MYIYSKSLSFLKCIQRRILFLASMCIDSAKNRHVEIWKSIAWASYQIRKIADYICAENAGNVFSRHRLQRNSGLAIPTCITARTCREACRDRYLVVMGKTFPAFPAHVQAAIVRIWQEAHMSGFQRKIRTTFPEGIFFIDTHSSSPGIF